MTRYKKDWKYSEYNEYEKKVRRDRALKAYAAKRQPPKPFICRDCGKECPRTSNGQKWCVDCKPKHVNDKTAEYNRQYRLTNGPKIRDYRRKRAMSFKIET